MRRPVAAVAAVLLIVEALGIGFVNWVLGLAVKRQSMSLGGLQPSAMSAGAWAAGALFALFLIACGVLLARIAIRDRAPGRVGRLVLIVCAVIHGVLGAVVVGMVGWFAFVALMVILGFLVLTLVGYGENGSTGQRTGTPNGTPNGTPTPTSP